MFVVCIIFVRTYSTNTTIINTIYTTWPRATKQAVERAFSLPVSYRSVQADVTSAQYI